MSQLNIDTARVFKPLLKKSRYKAVYGGRGSAKSHFFAELLIERHVMSKTDSVCVREIQRSLVHSVKKLLENKIEKLKVGHLFKVFDTTIRCKNGGQIIFQGMQNHTADSIKSLEGFDIAWVEEAQNISINSLELLRPTIRKPNSEIWFSWNPRLPTDAIEQLLRCDCIPEDTIIVKSNYKDNPWFTDVLKKEMLHDRSRDKDKYSHIWLGEYKKNSESRVFNNWEIKKFTRPVGTIYRFGADWGFANDPTVLVRFSIEGNTLFVDYEAVMVGCEIVNTPDLFRRIPESNRWFITADCSRPETISHMRKNGFPKINKSKKGKGSVEEGIEFLRSFDIIVHPRCEETIKELLNYSYKTDTATDDILPFVDKYNHVIDALRYGCEGIRTVIKNEQSNHYNTFIAADATAGY